MKIKSFSPQVVEAELERIVTLFRGPAPRVVDAAVRRASISSIANVLILMGVIQAFLGLVMGTVFGCLFGGAFALLGLFPLMITVPFLAFGLHSRRRTVRILSEGTLCKGRVTAVSPLPARINGRTFFRVRVEVRHAADGVAVTAADTVDNWAVEYFLNARDQQKDVDVLYTPAVP